ncbi:MAG: PHP domain-containing protein [Clostridia bacterium]|nr:PHP domain-containing protein [Clostridia bacterium]
MIGDMHCHSVYSDGFNTVYDLADYASRAGLTHLALTDHDTMMGVPALQEEASKKGITVIPGVECTCTDPQRGRSVHMLCYGPKHPLQLQALLNVTLRRRRDAKLAMTDLISKKYPLTRKDVLKASAQSASIYEVHVISPLAAMGYTPAVCGELLKELIGKQGSCYVPIQYPSVWEMVRVMREVGGTIVMAHPGQFDSMALAHELAQAHLLDGVECFHPRNSIPVTNQALALCREKDLLITGGSDFHGMYSAKPHPLGFCTTSQDQLLRLLEAVASPN